MLNRCSQYISHSEEVYEYSGSIEHKSHSRAPRVTAVLGAKILPSTGSMSCTDGPNTASTGSMTSTHIRKLGSTQQYEEY